MSTMARYGSISSPGVRRRRSDDGPLFTVPADPPAVEDPDTERIDPLTDDQSPISPIEVDAA